MAEALTKREPTEVGEEDLKAELHTEWDEPRYAAALSTLGRLQDQITNLRASLPSLFRPLVESEKYADPQDLCEDFTSIAYSTDSAVQKLKQEWNDTETQGVFERAKVRSQETRESDDMWNFAEMQLPRWASFQIDGDLAGFGHDMATVDALSGDTLTFDHDPQKNAKNNKQEVETSIDDEPSILEQFSRVHEDTAIFVRDETSGIVIVEVSSKPDKLVFEIARRATEQKEDWKYNVVCKAGGRLASPITRCAEKRPSRRDLNYALGMLVAFATEQMKPCQTCGQLLDKDALTPTAMREEQNSKGAEKWVPFHEQCID